MKQRMNSQVRIKLHKYSKASLIENFFVLYIYHKVNKLSEVVRKYKIFSSITLEFATINNKI